MSETEKDVEENVKRCAQDYRHSYELFLESIRNDNLDDQIDEYIRTLNT